MCAKQKILVILSGLAMLAPAPAFAAAHCNSAKIKITALSSPLGFGAIVPCTASAGTVTVDSATGARTTSGCISAVTGTWFRERVKLSAGQPHTNTGVRFTMMPTATVKTGGGKTMTVRSLNFYPTTGAAPAGDTITLSRRTSGTYWIGGTLEVGAGQATGSYAGTATITGACL